MSNYITFIFAVSLLPAIALAARTIRFSNRCDQDIWISPLTNNQGRELRPGIVHIRRGNDFTYKIPNRGWGGRFWPKMGCDGNGQNCEVGQSVPPCPPNGCDPPGETKVEFFFPRVGNGQDVWYDISLVDGYSIAAEIIPSKTGGSCRRTNCALSLDRCPVEKEVGDLKVRKNGKTVQCLSPCKKWNYPHPFGLGRPENQGNGIWYCCPTPPIQPGECRKSLIIRTKYVDLVHRDCPTAYSYSYDDEAGLHNCPNQVNFQVNFC